jgi:hypothetical protein
MNHMLKIISGLLFIPGQATHLLAIKLKNDDEQYLANTSHGCSKENSI